MSPMELRKLGAVSRQISSSVPQARDLELLSHLNHTVDLLADMTVRFESMALVTQQYVEIVQKANFESVAELEPLEDMFAQTLALTEDAYEGIVALRRDAVEDPLITDEDGIVEAYDCLLDQAAAFFNSLGNLSWIIGEHIAEADNVLPGEFTSAKALAEAMGA